MNAAAAHTLHPLVRKLESIAPLSDEERHAIVALPMMVRHLKADQDIVRDQDRPSQCCLILDGFACRYKVIEGGKRQIFSFHIPGDIPDLQSLHLDIMDHSLGTIVASKVAFFPHETVRAFIRAHPRIGDVVWRDTLIDAAIFREWMAGLGRREAYGPHRASVLRAVHEVQRRRPRERPCLRDAAHPGRARRRARALDRAREP
ncbi:MAG: Crp/Fnr family transcriptional regulator, partial [Microvirga sp.]